MLPVLIELGWKSALIAVLALIADRAMRGRPAAERVFVLRAAVVALVLLPAAILLLPSLDVALLPAPEAVEGVRAPMSAAVAPIPPTATGTGIDLVGLLYMLGAGAALLHLGIGMAVLARWTSRGKDAVEPRWQAALTRSRAQLRRPVRLLVSDDVVTPISWGIAPAWILIDRATLERAAQADAVIAHEMAHIRRFDWPMLVTARIVAALLWFNPLVWLLNRTLVRRGETAADEAAVRGIERADYAEALLSFATAPAARGVATGMALWPNALAERITHIATHRHRRGSCAIPAAALVCTAIAAPPLAVARLVPAAPASDTPITRAAGPGAAQATASALLAASATAPARAEPDRLSARPAATAPLPFAGDPSRALPQPTPVPAARVASAPQSAPLHIVGQTGASVIRRGDEAVTASPSSPPPPRSEETPEWAKQAANEISQAAREIRNGARNVELTAELPGVDGEERADIAKQVREMRAQADEFEARARALRGPGG